VIPVHNEEAVLPLLLLRLNGLISSVRKSIEVLLIDDGSTDDSAYLIATHAQHDPRFRYIGLSRNFGHQAAITAGMDLARGDAVIVMDADLQDPPEVAIDLISRWEEGYDIVHARRRSRAGETWSKKVTAAIFYRGLRTLTKVDIPADVGDFRLISRRAVETFRAMPERDRFVRGMFGWMGYRQTIVEFDRAERAAGKTKYPFSKMFKLALDGVLSFSDVPLRVALWVGAAISAGSVLYGFYVLIMALFQIELVSGWASLAVLISFLSGINLLMTGIVGVYVGRTHREVKQRPLYIIARDTGMPIETERSLAVETRVRAA